MPASPPSPAAVGAFPPGVSKAGFRPRGLNTPGDTGAPLDVGLGKAATAAVVGLAAARAGGPSRPLLPDDTLLVPPVEVGLTWKESTEVIEPRRRWAALFFLRGAATAAVQPCGREELNSGAIDGGSTWERRTGGGLRAARGRAIGMAGVRARGCGRADLIIIVIIIGATAIKATSRRTVRKQ